MRKFEADRRRLLAWLSASLLTPSAAAPKLPQFGRSIVPLSLTLQELANASRIKLPALPPVRIGSDRLRHFTALTGNGATLVADPAKEIDPLVALALLPSMLADLIVITDASANRIAGLQNCVFLRSIPAEAEISFEAELMQGQVNADGYVVYRIGFAWRIGDESPPGLVGEVMGMAGNPGRY